MEFEKGDRVKVKGENGTFVIKSIDNITKGKTRVCFENGVVRGVDRVVSYTDTPDGTYVEEDKTDGDLLELSALRLENDKLKSEIKRMLEDNKEKNKSYEDVNNKLYIKEVEISILEQEKEVLKKEKEEIENYNIDLQKKNQKLTKSLERTSQALVDTILTK